MRFKSRMFPLIDVMILMLGLFLVILAHAQLTSQPRDDTPTRTRPEAETQAGSTGVLVLVWDERTGACYTFDGQRVGSESELLLELADQQLAGRGGEQTIVQVLVPKYITTDELERVRVELGRPGDARTVDFTEIDDDRTYSALLQAIKQME